jgi:hypothetical protein
MIPLIVSSCTLGLEKLHFPQVAPGLKAMCIFTEPEETVKTLEALCSGHHLLPHLKDKRKSPHKN